MRRQAQPTTLVDVHAPNRSDAGSIPAISTNSKTAPDGVVLLFKNERGLASLFRHCEEGRMKMRPHEAIYPLNPCNSAFLSKKQNQTTEALSFYLDFSVSPCGDQWPLVS